MSLNANYSDILRLRSQEFYSSVAAVDVVGSSRRESPHSWQPILRSNSSLSLDQNKRQNELKFGRNSPKTGLRLNDFQELRECRFGNTETIQSAPKPSKSSANLMTTVSPKRSPIVSSETRAKSRTISGIHGSLSLSNENLNQKKQKKTKSLFFATKTKERRELSDEELMAEETDRRRRLRQLFIHYDIHSALALDQMFVESSSQTSDERRIETTSGPSSLSSSNSCDSLLTNGTTEERQSMDETVEEENESNSNALLCFSTNFRNEIGKEVVFCVQLNRENSNEKTIPDKRRPTHVPALARQLSCLSSFDMSADASQSALVSPQQSVCAFASDYDFSQTVLEADDGQTYYRKYFYGFSHQNWFQVLEPSSRTTTRTAIALSLRKDSKDLKKLRVVLRTSLSLRALKGFVDLNQIRPNEDSGLRGLLDLLLPRVWTRRPDFLSGFRLGADAKADDLLLKFDELLDNKCFKVGVLYAKDIQSSEEDFYNNRDVQDDDFQCFLRLIGRRVRLKGYTGFRGGLDVATDTTGSHAFATTFRDREVVFHVCHELPFSPTNRQQLLRKRHIGNDIVTIVFQSRHFRGPPFQPTAIRSHFQHVFVVVRPHANGYRVAVARHKDVAPFGPPLRSWFSTAEIRDFLLTKVLNAEGACHRCSKFRQMALRTRLEYLTDLYANYSTPTPVHSFGQQSAQLTAFSVNFNKYFAQIFPKKDKREKERDVRDDDKNIFRENELFFGAKLYESVDDVRDDALSRRDARVGVSRLRVHSFQEKRDLARAKVLVSQHVLVVLSERRAVFACLVEQIIGFLLTSSPQRDGLEVQLKIYFHFGELLLLREHLADDGLDSESRDANVEKNSLLFELKTDLMTRVREQRPREGSLRMRQMKEVVLRRNTRSSDASFGFHVQHKTLSSSQNVCVYVTDANEHASRVNELRPGQRLLELCQMSLQTLSYQEVLDFLRTSQTVSVALVQPLADGSPRTSGCLASKCVASLQKPSSSPQTDNDYENITTSTGTTTGRHMQTTPERRDNESPVVRRLERQTERTPPKTRSPHHSSAYARPQISSPTHTSHSQRPLHLKTSQNHFINQNQMSSQSSTTSSTFQEDLIKLITLNDADDDPSTDPTVEHTDSHSSSRYSTATSTPYSSLERRSSSDRQLSDDCVVTIAKPAFVVNPPVFARRLIDDAINSNVTSGTTTTTSVTDERELQEQVKELSKEKQRLNETIRQLKEENQRLHFESQTASQQLRKFTEWFFSSANETTDERRKDDDSLS
ncbi:signal-induced proliferation-associated 1-like protein 1 [Oppia nitens]|uniref:signal-induced proliferation-associated 1-like protein 1 n=1 Tax=Oppia nitens TaxID=1686743 RepID=UPI0023DA35F2|nr:signal-induced proliferation-associated 1-like protein 1 [Oppia nitens]